MTNRELPNIRRAIYGQPWAITEGWLEAICDIFEKNCNGKIDAAAFQKDPEAGDPLEFETVAGIAILPVMGPIFPRANLMTQMSGATSLDVLSAKIDRAMDDFRVESLLFQIDSPGGSVSGLSELATKIFGLRDRKGTMALAEGTAASAAYFLGSQAEAFFATEGAAVGSIGTVARIENADRALRNAGVDTVVLRSSELKAAGVGPLTPRQEDSLRAVLNSYNELFTSAVERGRPGIDIEAVSTGEVWIGQQAVDRGLVDEIATLPELIQRFGSDLD